MEIISLLTVFVIISLISYLIGYMKGYISQKRLNEEINSIGKKDKNESSKSPKCS